MHDINKLKFCEFVRENVCVCAANYKQEYLCTKKHPTNQLATNYFKYFTK